MQRGSVKLPDSSRPTRAAPAAFRARDLAQRAGKWALVELARLGERLRFGLIGGPDASAAIVVAGSGRSGTTWLMNVLASARGVQPIFEPLYPIWSETARSLTGFRGDDRRYLSSHYLRPADAHDEWRAYLGDLLTGKVRSYWTDFERTSFFPARFAIKLIRANLMLGYLYDQFQPRLVYITRHPCAVVAARVNLGWRADVSDLLAQVELVEDHLRAHVDKIAVERDPLGTHAVWWAVENAVASRELATRPHYRITYEELCQRPVELARDLADWLGIVLPRRLQPIARRPSRLSRKQHAALTVDERLSLWTRQLDAEAQRRILDWAHRLGVDFYTDALVPTASHRSGRFAP